MKCFRKRHGKDGESPKKQGDSRLFLLIFYELIGMLLAKKGRYPESLFSFQKGMHT